MQNLQKWEYQLFDRVATHSRDDLSDEVGAVVALLNMEVRPKLVGMQIAQDVLTEGKWREADAPKAYIKKAVTARAPKTHMDDRPDPGQVKSKAGPPSRSTGSKRRSLHHLTFMAGNEMDQFSADLDSDRAYENELKALESAAINMPREYWKPYDPPAWYARQVKKFNRSYDDRHIHLPVLVYNWKKIAEDAGLSSGEVRVVEYQSRKMSRDAALAEQPNDLARKELQAAWKRFDRSGKKKLREFMEKFREKCPD